jgi:hypothetical protein
MVASTASTRCFDEKVWVVSRFRFSVVLFWNVPIFKCYRNVFAVRISSGGDLKDWGFRFVYTRSQKLPAIDQIKQNEHCAYNIAVDSALQLMCHSIRCRLKDTSKDAFQTSGICSCHLKRLNKLVIIYDWNIPI